MHLDEHAAEAHIMANLACLVPCLALDSSSLSFRRAAIMESAILLRQISSHYTDRHMILFAGMVH
jgi:hypothetical protein